MMRVRRFSSFSTISSMDSPFVMGAGYQREQKGPPGKTQNRIGRDGGATILHRMNVNPESGHCKVPISVPSAASPLAFLPGGTGALKGHDAPTLRSPF